LTELLRDNGNGIHLDQEIRMRETGNEGCIVGFRRVPQPGETSNPGWRGCPEEHKVPLDDMFQTSIGGRAA
jgi:hypothetical protein